MNPFARGVRNAFRNTTRTVSVVLILSISIGLALAMLLAHSAVNQKIASVKSSVGNTISITPAGFSSFSQVNNALSSSQLNKVLTLAHVTGVNETLTDRLTTIGSSSPSFGFGAGSATNTSNQTNLTSPVTINFNSRRSRFFVNGGFTPPSNFSPPITILGTNDPGYINNSSLSLMSGSYINGGVNKDVAMVSVAMASKNNLKVGSSFTAYSTSLTVSGIFHSSSQSINNDVIVSLPTEQTLSGQSGDVTAATAYVDSIDNLASTTTAVKNLLGSNADVESAQQQANNTVQPLENVSSISLYSVIGAVIASAVIILLIMIMIVRERRREIGVLKAIGSSNIGVALQFMTEAVSFTVLAAIIGVIIGIIAGNPITNMLVKSSSTSTSANVSGGNAFAGRFGGGGGAGFGGGNAGGGHFGFRFGGGGFSRSITNLHTAVGWNVFIYGLIAAIFIALIGSAVASYFITKVKPAEVLRTE